MMAKVWLVGRIGQAPESKTVGDKTVWRFSLATSRSKKTATGGWEDITDWHSCQYWGNLPKNAGKGALMALAGTLESWKSGDKSGWQVNVNDVRVLTKGEEVAAAAPEPAVSQEQIDTYTKALNDKFGEVKISKIDDNELPF
jgi:single-strand DNA-binding protein